MKNKIKINKLKKETVELLGVFLLIILVYFLLQKAHFNTDLVREYVQSRGELGKLIFVFYMIISTMFSPLNSLILLPVVYISYGFWQSVILTYLGNVVGGTLNFWVARRYGRPLLKKFLGKKSIKKIDNFTEIGGWKSFFIVRLIGGNYYDYVSYAVGLTKMDFIMYFVVTIITSFFWMTGTFIVIGHAVELGGVGSVVLIGSTLTLSFMGGASVVRKYTKNKDI